MDRDRDGIEAQHGSVFQPHTSHTEHPRIHSGAAPIIAGDIVHVTYTKSRACVYGSRVTKPAPSLPVNNTCTDIPPYKPPSSLHYIHLERPFGIFLPTGDATTDNIVIYVLSSFRFVTVITIIIASVFLVSLWRHIRGRRTTLLEASKSNQACILIEAGQVDVPIQPLGKCSSQVNIKDCCGQTELSIAAERGEEHKVKLLLEIDNVDVNSKDLLNWTPLSYAAFEGHEGVVKLLLDRHDVEADSRDSYYTPLSRAAMNDI